MIDIGLQFNTEVTSAFTWAHNIPREIARPPGAPWIVVRPSGRRFRCPGPSYKQVGDVVPGPTRPTLVPAIRRKQSSQAPRSATVGPRPTALRAAAGRAG
ncbi:collagen alpha-1(XXVIII) chain-like protein [Lates japonicus]|uniref:Collagen alpha-1(XXVIII) chain-like protein n=1 Tax=Lates japonicus TaxID=270547 RepID=A0AAD3N8R5_LATJO|nr:collagen alpha-1(XXVIII) chain-like protein [Lates japonicus]